MKPLCIALSLCSLTACGASAYDRVQHEDTVEAYTRFLREAPSDPRASEAKKRLAELEFQKVRRQGSVLAYKRFLDAFPESERRRDAEVQLEGLRFEAGAKADTSDAWNEFLREHPAGAHAGEARARLEEADWRAALAADSARALEEFVARHPDSAHRLDGDRLLDDRRFGEAQGHGVRALASYLEKNPAGTHREAVRGQLAQLEADARIWLLDLPGARKAAEMVPDEAARARALAAVAAAELEQATARLDPKALESFATAHDGELAGLARARAKAVSKAGDLKELATHLMPAHFARPADELVRVLGAPDPRDRWLAAEELGRMGARDAFEPLLDTAALSRFGRVRERAFAALKALTSPMPALIRESELRPRLEALKKLAQSVTLEVKVAVLEELLGEEEAAIADYQRAARDDPSDLFVLRRLTGLRIQRKEGFGTAVAARELATRVLQLVEARESEDGLSPLLLARTLCGARDWANNAADILHALPPNAVQDFPEDLALFNRRAVEAQKLASARLSDTEAEARQADRSFKSCDDDGGVRERLAEGEADRLRTVEKLAGRQDEAVRVALGVAARLDPARPVREAASKALAPKGP